MDILDDFNDRRERGNKIISEQGSLLYNRFFNIDTIAYKEGALSEKTKHLIGLSCSLMPRCNDCVMYHLQECVRLNCSRDEINEAMGIALLIGGSIVIPELRKAVETMELLLSEKD